MTVRLLPLNDQSINLATGNAEAFESCYGVRIGACAEYVRDVAVQTAAMLKRTSREAPWGGYVVVDAESNLLVGACGFKNAPSTAGTVEIAYYTFPPFERRGYATASAAEMVAIARSSPLVRTIIAHTLPELSASTRVLKRNGFRFAGEVIDPEDGRVWRWERGRSV